MLSFIRYLTEAKDKPDAMQRFADRALARIQRQPAPAKSPLASLNTDPKIDPRNGYPTAGVKYWYHPDSRKLVPVGIDGDHGWTVLSTPDTFGITDKEAQKNPKFFTEPIHAAIRNGWVRLDASGDGLTVEGTQAQAHKVIREHHAATGGARPMYYVDHFIDNKGSSSSHGGFLEGNQDIEHYINNFGTPPMGAKWDLDKV